MTDHFSTQAVHAGELKRKLDGALTTPIVQTSTYTFANTAEILDFMQQKADGEPDPRHEYGRYSNPTQSAAERKMAILEGGEGALLFASGMGAITTAILALLSLPQVIRCRERSELEPCCRGRSIALALIVEDNAGADVCGVLARLTALQPGIAGLLLTPRSDSASLARPDQATARTLG